MILYDVIKFILETFNVKKADTNVSESSYSSDINQSEYSDGANEASASKVDVTKNIGKVNNNFENDEFGFTMV